MTIDKSFVFQMEKSTKEARQELKKDRETMREITQNWNNDKFDVMVYSFDKTVCGTLFLGGVITVTWNRVQKKEEL